MMNMGAAIRMKWFNIFQRLSAPVQEGTYWITHDSERRGLSAVANQPRWKCCADHGFNASGLRLGLRTEDLVMSIPACSSSSVTRGAPIELFKAALVRGQKPQYRLKANQNRPMHQMPSASGSA